jgi:nicotinate phosphoribosyltransferase
MNSAAAPAGEEYALLTDLYQLTMLQAYIAEDMHGTAVFDLFARRLPRGRNYLVACGLQDALEYLLTLRFEAEALAYLDTLGLFTQPFLDYLADFRFSGEVQAVPEGTVVFADEPVLEVIAPLPEAQIVETFVLNQVHFQTLVASKAARVVAAAGDRKVVDFGLRRYHGIDAGLKAARAAWVAGVGATSNVLAGQRYGIPVSGTMAHSYILAHGSEREAFERFAGLYPQTVLLVDTYDTLQGVRKVVDLAHSLGVDFQVQAIRLDSGDLLELSIAARQILDAAGLQRVGIFASGDLDEYRIGELLGNGAPIDGFGVGTHMGTSADAPFLNSAYKLVSYDGESRMKLSSAKATLPGRKQVYRQRMEGEMVRDVIALHEEPLADEPLLVPVMRGGKPLRPPPPLSTLRETCRRSIATLPARLRGPTPAEPPYPVGISAGIERERREAINKIKNIL